MKVSKSIFIMLAGIASVLILIAFMAQGVQNKAISMEEQINSAKADVEVQEKRRVDLVGNLVDTVKEYDKHEYETLKAIVDGRSSKDVKISDVTTIL